MMPRQFKNDHELRRRQIDTIKIFNHNVTEIKENEEYQVGFNSNGLQLCLTVELGPAFPNEKPRLTIFPAVSHHWISSNGEVQNAPGLINFTVHSDLGRVIQAIISHFERFPPSPINDEVQSSNDHSSTPPSAEVTIPELSSLTLEELKKIDSDPEVLEDFVEEMHVVVELNEELNSLMNDVQSIAEENILKKREMDEMKMKLGQQFIDLRELGEQYEIRNNQYQKKAEEFAPQNIKEILQIAASTSDTDCENCVEKFLGKEIDIQTFLNQYMEAKKLSAMRKAKEEQLNKQLNALERAAFN